LNEEFEPYVSLDHNFQQLLWRLRWAGSSMKDEWVAILMGELFMYWENLLTIDDDWDKIIDINKISIDPNNLLMWEILSLV
jgi:hypothetical protein